MLDSSTHQGTHTVTSLDERDRLLASTLRDHPLQWPYRSEYPIVLAPEAQHMSQCLYDNGSLVAHASLWPRTLQHVSKRKFIPLAFVGNVCTTQDRQGQGLQRQLLAHVEKTAALQGAKAVVLWSDLHEFYQKLGYSSIGRELRLTFGKQSRLPAPGIRKVAVNTLSDGDLESMLALRPKLEWCLQRSMQEFRALLTIPETFLFVNRVGPRIQSWCVIGKGSDMAGIVHEWGAPSAKHLCDDLFTLIQDYRLESLTLLAPLSLPSTWTKELRRAALAETEHPMAYAKTLGSDGSALPALARGFIWGLDSI